MYTDDGYYLLAHILAYGTQAIRAYWERGIKAGGHIDFVKLLTLYYSGNLGYFEHLPGDKRRCDGRWARFDSTEEGKWQAADGRA